MRHTLEQQKRTAFKARRDWYSKRNELIHLVELAKAGHYERKDELSLLAEDARQARDRWKAIRDKIRTELDREFRDQVEAIESEIRAGLQEVT